MTIISGAAMFWIAFHYLAVLACGARVLLRPNRDPAARVAWLAILLALPFLGVIAYILLGETNIGRRQRERVDHVAATLPDPGEAPGWPGPVSELSVPAPYDRLFTVGQQIGGYGPVGGNRGELMENSDTTVDRMVRDIDAASDHVHLMFYIWLPDTNGTRMAEALKRAAGRGVACRAIVDDLGSRDLIRNALWSDMQNAGVKLARALPVGNPLVRMFNGRIDIRNHRKILVIDNHITYCGSQNCADPAFLPKAKYAPWVDAMIRFEGPVARQNQHLFAGDWMASHNEDIRSLLHARLPETGTGFVAQVVASGPTLRQSAMPEMFAGLCYAAERELVITTPYYVPNGPLQAALCAAANRGVEVTMVLPARNDDFAVGATSRSYYLDLLTAGVRLHEYQRGLLHTKSVVVDRTITLIGSANMDRRSFDLNYENNILFFDPGLSAAMRARQDSYIADSRPVTLAAVAGWPWHQRLLNNALATLGPVL